MPDMSKEIGKIFAVERGAEPIDPALCYRIVFAVTKPAPEGGAPHHDLVRLARMMTLLEQAELKVEAGEIVAIVSGPATAIVRHGDAANGRLIDALIARGATIAVCGQALHHQGVDRAEVAPDVRIDVSALSTLANLQLRGWALIPG
jgi:intracellular sulfur oxidation DsrE/DsrF family protein